MRLLTPDQARELDQISMDDLGISGTILMGNAGSRISDVALELVADFHNPFILIICGKGNNGGDGYAAALELSKNNINVKVHSLYSIDEYKGDLLDYYLKCHSSNISITFGIDLPDFTPPDLIIDGLFGIGFKGKLKETLVPWVEWINNTKSSVLSIDIPSGLDGNSGTVINHAIKSKATVTFGAPKLGCVLRQGKNYSGLIYTKEIGFPNLDTIQIQGLDWELFEEFDVNDILKKPDLNTNKYTAGKVLVIAGSRGMTGAAILSTFGALRSGAGLTITTTPASLNGIMERSILEGMTLPLEDGGSGYIGFNHYDEIMNTVEWADTIVLGPGLGRERHTQKLICKLVSSIEKPIILDADGLYPFSDQLEKLNKRENPLVITPHLGELSNLIGKNKNDIIFNFPIIMTNLMKDFHHVALVKQVPNCTFYKNHAIVNSSGNPGLATGGTGDILAGMIGSLIAQNYNPFNASSLASFLHGKASDMLVNEKGYRGQIASDLLDKIPSTIGCYERF